MSSSSFIVHVHIRDCVFDVSVGDAQQTVLWLCNVASSLYAAAHPHFTSSQLTPVHCHSGSRLLLPSSLLVSVLSPSISVFVELLGPALTTNSPSHKRERSIWELFAYTPNTAYTPAAIVFDASQLSLKNPPGIYGNFNAWSQPLTMKLWKNSIYVFYCSFPPGAELLFKFYLGPQHGDTVSTHYSVVSDDRGNSLNYLLVPRVFPSYASFSYPQLSIRDLLAAQAQQQHNQIAIVSSRLAGYYRSWRRDDIAPSPQLSSDVKAMFRSAHAELSKHFTGMAAPLQQYINIFTFLLFCKSAKFVDSQSLASNSSKAPLTSSMIEQFYWRSVQRNQDIVTTRVEVRPPAAGSKTALYKADPFSCTNRMYLQHFYDALIRLASHKYSHVDASTAVESLLKTMTWPNTTDLRARLSEPQNIAVFTATHTKLLKLFSYYVGTWSTSAASCVLPPTPFQHDDDSTPAFTLQEQKKLNWKELEALLLDYELIDSSISRSKAFSQLGITIPVEENEHVSPDQFLSLTYLEFLELLGRVAEGTRWTNSAVAAEREKASSQPAAPTSALAAAFGSMVDDDVPAASSHDDDTELAERLRHLFAHLFPSAEEQARRRAKLQQQALAIKGSETAHSEKADKEKGDKDKGDKGDNGKESAKESSRSTAKGKKPAATKAATKEKPTAKEKGKK